MARLVSGLLSVSAPIGCHNTPPSRVPVPSSSDGNPYSTYSHDPVKPLPPSATQSLRESARSADDSPAPPAMVEIAPPALPVVSAAYLDSYDRVGRPRILVTVVRPD